MKRGDVVVVIAARGAYTGKPRPAVLVQSDLFNDTHASVTVCPITSNLRDAPLFRIHVAPTMANGLKKGSQVMVDKVVTIAWGSVGKRLGILDDAVMQRIDAALRLWLSSLNGVVSL